MNRHESHDPGAPRREAAETARQGRLTLRLLAGICVLAGAVVMAWLARG